MDRCEFATLLPSLLAGSALLPAIAEGQSDASTSSLPSLSQGCTNRCRGKAVRRQDTRRATI